ncbi:MAG TPA: isocitrate/isopropylmalate dehydrogenase family protein [Chloroflexota bacterium]|nr:isocitrate/isopropylmalate dehydrogenase family protein [Chloroflexota bacterium]
MAHTVTLIPGDGIGPEISEATRRVVESTGVQINWEVENAGADVMARYGTPLPERVLDSIRRTKVALKGPLTTPVGKGFRSVNVALRQELNLYANLRPCKYYPGVRSRFPGTDLIVVRENTEGLYSGIEFQEGKPETAEIIADIERLSGKKIPPRSGITIKNISVEGTRRIVRFAFEYARKNGRKKVTCVHKANIQKFTDGLFLAVATDVAAEFPEIQYEDRIVDNMCMQLVQKPELYDVLVMENLYGDVLSDLCAGLVGGLGVAPGANLGIDTAVFEAIHGSAPKYAGQNKVNPTALMLSAVLMLRHLGEPEAGDRMENAIAAIIAEGKNVTYDLKPQPNDPTTVGTSQMADAIIAKIQGR